MGKKTDRFGVPIVKDEVDEQALIISAQAGDQSAFGRLVRLFHKRLFRFILGLLGSFDQAEDVVQEAFIKAWGALGSFDPTRPFYPWLSVIARNLAFNLMKRDQKSESLESIAEKGFDPVSQDLGPLDSLLDGENEKRFMKALSAMPQQYRTVFVLRHVEELNYSEIAAELKIKPGTVDSRLYRARQFLVDQLKDLLGE